MPALLALLVHAAPMFALAACLLLPGRSAKRNSPRCPPSAPEPSGPGALLQIYRLGDTRLGHPVRGAVRVLPGDGTGAVVELTSTEGWPLVSLAAGQIVMARAWSARRLVASFGEHRPGYGSPAAVEVVPDGWELHVVDASGLVIRCHGLGRAPRELGQLSVRLRRARSTLT